MDGRAGDAAAYYLDEFRLARAVSRGGMAHRLVRRSGDRGLRHRGHDWPAGGPRRSTMSRGHRRPAADRCRSRAAGRRRRPRCVVGTHCLQQRRLGESMALDDRHSRVRLASDLPIAGQSQPSQASDAALRPGPAGLSARSRRAAGGVGRSRAGVPAGGPRRPASAASRSSIGRGTGSTRYTAWGPTDATTEETPGSRRWTCGSPRAPTSCSTRRPRPRGRSRCKHELGDNFGDTFRVEDGFLKVAYDKYKNFDGQFGHLFYEKPLSNYLLRVEYRFVGSRCPGGASWASATAAS